MQIFVRLLSGKIVSLDVKESYTIDQVKEEIEKREGGIPKATQELLYSGSPLKNTKTIADYGIVQECTIFLVVKKVTEKDPDKFKVLLVEGGSKFLAEVQKTTSIWALKGIAHNGLKGLMQNGMDLVFKGQKLDNKSTVGDNNLKSEDTILVVTSAHGGNRTGTLL